MSVKALNQTLKTALITIQAVQALKVQEVQALNLFEVCFFGQNSFTIAKLSNTDETKLQTSSLLAHFALDLLGKSTANFGNICVSFA